MYRVLFLIIFFGYLVLNLNAQLRQLASFRITLPDTSGAQFFGHNSGLHRLFVEFEDEMPMSISLYRGADSHDSNVDHIADEFYDLKFEEDRCLLKKKYGQINIPELPVLSIAFLTGIGDMEHLRTRYDVKATVFKDSIAYSFNLWGHLDTLGSFGEGSEYSWIQWKD